MKKIIFLLACSYVCCGCVPASNLENNLSQIPVNKNNEPVDETVNEKSDLERANAIKENIILHMKEIEAVAVVVESHTALIGIRPLEEFAGDSVQLKQEAGKWAKETDTDILAASVTTSEHIITMIEELERKRQV